MRKKIKFYKSLLNEVIETLCTISLIMYRLASRAHLNEAEFMYDHFLTLKDYSKKIREQNK